MSALAKLEQLQGDVVAQRGRVADLDRARRDRPREFEMERAKRLAAIRESEARGTTTDLAMGRVGEDAIVVEAGLDAPEMTDVERAAMVGLSPRAVTRPLGPGVSDVQIEWVDEDAEERLAGAQEALQAAEDRLSTFAASYFADLEVERAPRAAAAQEALASAMAACRAAAAEYERERNWQMALLKLAARDDLTDDLPSNPGAWLAEAPRTVPVPMPQSLVA